MLIRNHFFPTALFSSLKVSSHLSFIRLRPIKVKSSRWIEEDEKWDQSKFQAQLSELGEEV